MNQGISLQELAAQLEHVEKAKKDWVVPSTKMRVVNAERMVIDDEEVYTISPLAHEQIGARLGIPREYYKRMQRDTPALLDQNINTWLRHTPERRLVRTLDGKVRAVLSDKYKPQENFPLASVLLPTLRDAGNVEIVSANLTPKNMFVKAISHELTGEVRVGDIVKGGISVRNSEVGCGAFEVSLFVLRLVCMNGMIREHSIRSRHVGKRINIENDESAEIYSAEAIAADSHAFMLKVRDVLRHAFDKKKFDEEIARFQAAADNQMNPRAIPETIEDVTKRFSLTMEEGKETLSRLVASKDFTQWGLSSAVTNIANDIPDYERSTELERVGGQIINLNQNEWRSIIKLAA